MSAVHTSAVFGRRACALLAATSALLHVLMLGHAGNAVIGGLLVVMIVGCLYCARDLWQRGTPGIWCTVALMNLAMIALHTPMPAHHHGAGAGPLPAQSTLMNLTVSLALVEVVIAGTVLYYRTRDRSVTSLPAA
ncbi:hypothetical protein EB73_09275 [Mycobacterium sp. SWH-M3]|nr:hypothetical protein EB73_09275 [Mycobacterium sp. SWH-M3]